jgi:hypothetical protein
VSDAVLQRLLVPLALAALLLATGCTEAVSPGLRVGDATVSHDEMLDEIGQWADNRALAGQFGNVSGPSPGSYSTEIAAAVIGYRIQRELIDAEVRRRDLDATDAQVDEARELVFGPDPALAAELEDGFSDAYAERLVQDASRQLALFEELGEDGFVEWISESTEETRIEVSSRFGRWDDASRQVLPPTGPVTPTTVPVAPPVGDGTGGQAP